MRREVRRPRSKADRLAVEKLPLRCKNMKIHRRGLWLLKLAFSLTLLAVLYRRMNWAGFRDVFTSAHLPWFIPIFLLLLTNTALSALKWKLLLAADGIRVPYLTLFSTYWIGTFFNLFLPSSIGGDAYRVYDLARRSARAAEGFASVLADRLTGFLAIAIWGLLFSWIGFSRLPDRGVIWIPLFVFLAIGGGVVLLMQRRQLRTLLRCLHIDRAPKLAAFVERFLASMDAYLRNPPLLAKAMAISLAFQFLAIVAIGLMARLLGWTISFIFFCVFVPLITLIEALPISIFGLGVRDAAYAFFFVPVGVVRERALALPLLYLAITVLYAAVGGVLFLIRRTPARPSNAEGSR